MLHPSTTVGRRRRRPAALLVMGTLLLGLAVGCSGSNDSASTTTASTVTASTSAGVEDLAAACREVDLVPIQQAADDFVAAEAALDVATSEQAVTTAFVTLLDKGSVLFSTMASSLEDLFGALADAARQPALADVPDGFRTAADDFSALATDINEAGTITEADVSRIDEVGASFDELDALVEPGSEGGQELRRVPACETFVRNFEAVFADLDGDGGTSGGTDAGEDGVNTDVADGVCDQDRWLQDPDCGDESVVNSDLADGSCDESRFFTDPDC